MKELKLQILLIESVSYTHLTYAEFAAETDLVARGLMAMGIKRGDKVAIWATNHQQWLINMYATAKIGAIMVTVNTSYKRFEL